MLGCVHGLPVPLSLVLSRKERGDAWIQRRKEPAD